MSQQAMSPGNQTVNTTPMAGGPMSPSQEPPSFSEKERNMLRDEDYRAARLVVGIMASVFTIGLALYIYIACLAAMGGD